jgi:hypothetical protein
MNTSQSHEPWNKGKLIGQKSPLRLKDIWAIRFHLQQDKRIRDLALFNLAIDSKLRGCDLVDLRVRDVTHGNQIMSRAMVMQRKTQRPVQFELSAERFPSYHDAAICQNRASMGSVCRSGYFGLWNAHDATYKGYFDIPSHKEPTSHSTTARTQQVGKYNKILGY